MSCYKLILAEKAGYAVSMMCALLGVCRSGFYAWMKREPSNHAKEDERLGAMAEEVFGEHRGRYGAPRVHAELAARGERVACKRIARLLKDRDCVVKPKKRYRVTTKSSPTATFADNVLNRDFQASGPNQKWVTDITFIHTLEGWLYLAVLLDLFSRRVVGWSMSDTITRQLPLDALTMAVQYRGAPAGLIHHSDRGSQYTSGDYQKRLKAFQTVPSMSRKGNCWDNAVAESFFATLEKELLISERFESRIEARAAVFEYIEIYYNRKRRHSTLGYLSPVEFERLAVARDAA